MTDQQRVIVAMISPSPYGGYLVSGHGDLAVDATPDQVWEAASSKTAAKRAAVDIAEGLGYHEPWLWVVTEQGVIELHTEQDQ